MAKSSALKLLLIIANSGRMLAYSAQRAGYQALVIDRFGDSDTAQFALENWLVEELTIDYLQPILEKIVNHYTVEQVLVGSGFEAQSETLVWLQTKYILLANSGATIKRIGNSQCFFDSLQHLQIKHPETSFQPPESNTNQWLVKPQASEGGLGIRFYHGQDAEENDYWQRYQPGQVYSVLFVANAVNAKVLGINRQWVTEQADDQVFIFSGVVIDQESCFDRHREMLDTWIVKLTNAYNLVGLNGIDFIIDDDQCWLLEINPRPPASMVLYAQDNDLIKLHIEACNGNLPELSFPIVTEIRAYQIVYARASISIPVDFNWPEWVSDRARAKTNIDTHQPICSIIASANTTSSALQLLQRRSKIIYQLFHTKGLA